MTDAQKYIDISAECAAKKAALQEAENKLSNMITPHKVLGTLQLLEMPDGSVLVSHYDPGSAIQRSTAFKRSAGVGTGDRPRIRLDPSLDPSARFGGLLGVTTAAR